MYKRHSVKRLGLCQVLKVKAERFFLQAEGGIRDLDRTRGLGDVYKGQIQAASPASLRAAAQKPAIPGARPGGPAGGASY